MLILIVLLVLLITTMVVAATLHSRSNGGGLPLIAFFSLGPLNLLAIAQLHPIGDCLAQ